MQDWRAALALWDGLLPVWAPWALALALLAGLFWAASRQAGFRRDAEAQQRQLAQDLAESRAQATAEAQLIAARHQAEARAAADLQARLGADLAEAREQLHLASQEARGHAVALSRAQAELAGLRERQDRADEALAQAEALCDSLRQAAERRQEAQAERAQITERQIATLRTELEAERAQGAEKLALLATVRSDMEARFKELADQSLRQSNEALSQTNRERLEAALAPLKNHVDLFQQELRQAHEGALRDRQALKTEIAQLTQRSEQVSREAVALTRALKGDKQRQGAWGEMVLESLLERSGLRAGEEYLTQSSHTPEEGGRLRSDVIVRMPNDSCLVIDSKVSLVDYELAVNSEDPEEIAAARRRHALSIKRHVETLAAKNYQLHAGQSVDYVVMFIPIEGAFSEALREMGDLSSFALDRNVTLATPTTLMMALRTVASFWTIDRRNRNADAIAERAGRLYDKVAGFVDELDKIGRALGQAQAAYGTAMDRLRTGRGNVLSQVEQLKRLGARTSKSLPADFEDDDAPGAEDRPGALPQAPAKPAE